MMRGRGSFGTPVLRICPKVLLAMFVSGLQNSAWLKTLKNSPRISNSSFSVIAVVFESVINACTLFGSNVLVSPTTFARMRNDLAREGGTRPRFVQSYDLVRGSYRTERSRCKELVPGLSLA